VSGDPALLAHVDPDREWCDLASWVWVECERRCGDRVTTDVRIFIASLPPRARPLLQAVRQHWRGRKRPPLGPGHGLWRGRQPHPHGPRRPQHGHSQAHRPQPVAAGPILRVGIANKRLAAAWNKDYLCQLIGLKPKPI